LPDTPPTNDRAVLASMQKLKAYSGYKARQSQTPPAGGPSASDNDLQTVETWANDPNDSGAAWGEHKQQDSNQKVRESEAWKEQVRRDDQDAAAENDFRSKLDVKAAKEELKKKLDDHVAGLQALADGGEPGFKGKLTATKKETADAKKFLDENFEKSLDNAAKRGAEQRQERKAVAQAMEKRGEEGKKWQADYGDQPGKFPAGQRADVQAALDRISAAAGEMAAEIQPFGATAAPHVERLQKVQAWVAKLKPQVDSQGPALKAAKALGASGAAEARSTFAGVEAFQAGLEGEASDNLELFRRWTDENNRLAKQWANSPSEKHRQWAQNWMNVQNS
jgi:hypothetical protein